MISTGFPELNNIIGGLKKGKLYGLATFNFDHVAAEYFALNLIANAKVPAFFHSGIMAGRMASTALAGQRFFRVGDIGEDKYPMPDFPCRDLFFNRKSDELAEDVCEKFQLQYRNTPFELAVIDIKFMTSKEQFPHRQHETSHIIGLFRALAEKHHIPAILIGRCHDIENNVPGEQLKSSGYPRTLIESSENILLLSKASRRGDYGMGQIDHDLDLTIYDHFFRKETLPVYSYTTSDVFPNYGRYTHEKLRLLKREVKKNMASAMAEIQKIQDPVTLFREMKFGRLGFAPRGSYPENIVEQLNQSFTILVSCYAAEKYFPEAAGFEFAFASAGGRDMIACDKNGEVIAEAEIFTAVEANNNRKLRRDVDRMREAEVSPGVRRMICYSARHEYVLKPKPGDETVEVKFCPLDELVEWIRE